MNLRNITRVVRGQETSDGAGVRLKRSIGTYELDHLDPFLLLDEFKSEDSGDYIAGFPDHPHRGFETVTYMLAGAMEHRDHAGNKGNLVAGSVQWMTAGKGIIHSEMPKQDNGLMWGFQLWINLPSKLKMSPPRYQDIPPEDIPETRPQEGVLVRVIAGEAGGVSGPVLGVATEPLYLDVSLPAHTRFIQEVSRRPQLLLLRLRGRRVLRRQRRGGRVHPSPAGHLAVLGDGDGVSVSTAASPLRLILLAAKPIGEPVRRHGPFVMNTEEELREAMADLRAGTFLD